MTFIPTLSAVKSLAGSEALTLIAPDLTTFNTGLPGVARSPGSFSLADTTPSNGAFSLVYPSRVTAWSTRNFATFTAAMAAWYLADAAASAAFDRSHCSLEMARALYSFLSLAVASRWARNAVWAAAAFTRAAARPDLAWSTASRISLGSSRTRTCPFLTRSPSRTLTASTWAMILGVTMDSSAPMTVPRTCRVS